MQFRSVLTTLRLALWYAALGLLVTHDAEAAKTKRVSSLKSLASQLALEDEQSSVLDELSSERDDARIADDDKEGGSDLDAAQLTDDLVAGVDSENATATTDSTSSTNPADPSAPETIAAKTNALSAAASGNGMAPRRFEERLSAAESENAQLRQLLAQADNYENELWAKFKAYKEDAATAAAKVMGKSKAVPQLHHQVRDLEGEVKTGFKRLAEERKQMKAIKLKLVNVSRSSGQHQRAMGWAQLHLASLQRQNSALFSLLKNASDTNHELEEKLELLNQENAKLQGQVKDASDKVHQKEADEKHLEEQKEEALAAESQLEEQADAQQKRIESEEISAKAVESSIDPLRKKVNDTQESLTKESASLEQWQAKDNTLTSLVKNAASNTSKLDKKLHKLTAVEAALKRKVQTLKKQADDEEEAREQVDEATKKVVNERARAEVEVKNLRGSGPVLEAQVASEEEKVQKAAVEEKKAFQERDAAQAQLAAVQRKISDLEKRYSSTVAVLGKAEAKPSPAEAVVPVKALTAVADDAPPPSAPEEHAAAEEQHSEGDYDDHDLEDKFDALLS